VPKVKECCPFRFRLGCWLAFNFQVSKVKGSVIFVRKKDTLQESPFYLAEASLSLFKIAAPKAYLNFRHFKL